MGCTATHRGPIDSIMSGNNPYSRQHQGGRRNEGNNYNGNRNENKNGNDFQIHNPYSPNFQRNQPQLAKPNDYTVNEGSINDSRRPVNNPYSQKTQQQQPQPSVQNRYRNPGNASFAISVAQPQEHRRHEQQQQSDREQSHQSHTNMIDNTIDTSKPSEPNTEQSSLSTKEDQTEVLRKLQEQLDQSTESNVDLEFSVATLTAELQHTRQTLQEQADREKSKLEHELRLAQQESKRWKLLAQQHQHGRSIVREAAPIEPQHVESAFSNRLLGDSAGLKPSLSSPKKVNHSSASSRNQPKATTFEDESSIEIDAPAFDPETQSQNSTQSAVPTTDNHAPQQQYLPVARLARNLLEQLPPFSMKTSRSPKVAPYKTKQVSKETDKSIKNFKAISTPSTPMDVDRDKENNLRTGTIKDDTSIRRVLLMLSSVEQDIDNSRSSISYHDADRDLNSPGFRLDKKDTPTEWTEGKLLEWLVKTSSSERYWFAILSQSREARKHVVEQVCNNWNEFAEYQLEQKQSFRVQPTPRRRQRNRIQPLSNSRDDDSSVSTLIRHQDQIRCSLRDPWWNPNDKIRFSEMDGGTLNGRPVATDTSSWVFRQWVVSLAASRNIRKLHSLRILLAEHAGRMYLANPSVTSRRADTDDEESSGEAWWDLCYPSIATTIQEIVYRKLIRSKARHTRKVPSGYSVTANRSNNNTRNNPSATNSINHVNRRHRIGRFRDRLDMLPKVVRIPQHGVTKSQFSTFLNSAVGKTGFDSNEEDDENEVLAYALSVWEGLLQVASSEKLDVWYKDRHGLSSIDKSWQKKKNQSPLESSQSPPVPPPCGGMFMVSLLLDLIEDLQFSSWMCQDNKEANAMALSQLLSTGVLPNERNFSERRMKESSKKNQPNDSSPLSILPPWYDASIAVLVQVGRTRDGMKILRARSLDDKEQNDWMGNALDVSIRQLHTLVLHLDDISTRHGSILRLEEYSYGEKGSVIDEYQSCCKDLWGDPQKSRLLRAVEAWVRFWHQILFFVQSTDGVSFRSLVLDLQDWFTSSCATLLSSEDIRREIKAMIRWQLDELMMDEEDYEELQRDMNST